MALPAAAAQAEIYTCTGQGRLPIYQNFPCQFDSLCVLRRIDGPAGSLHPGDAHRNASQPPRREPTTVLRTEARRAAPRVGMSAEQVQAIWGEPRNSTKEEFAKRDIETWTYANSRSIVFDRKGIVTSIHW